VNWTKHPLLVPQTIATTELNYSGIPINNINYSLSMFYNRLDKLINRRTTSSASGSIITENNNTGKMETIGGELQVIFKPVDKLMLDVSMSYQKTTNKIFDIDAAYSPKVLAYLKVIYNIRKDIIFGFSSYYVGNMESEWDEAPVDPKNGNFTPKGRLYKTTPAYLNLGANLRFNNILNTGFYFSVHADNILNTDIYYPPTTLNISYLPKGTLDNGIQLNATLGLKF
jgi:outer membrane receptor protein involved in Fe transport